MPSRTHRTLAAPTRTLRRSVTALALGVSALALAVPLTAPASAAPGGPAAGTSSTSTSTEKSSSARKLTAAAAKSGIEYGNATMGWRERGVERAAAAQDRAGLLRYGRSTTSSKAPAFTPDGVLGIDIASYQRGIKFSTWTGRDRQFVYIKATEGTSYKNPYFSSQFSGSGKAGMMHGAYHFASPNGKAGYKQARYFVSHGGAWKNDGTTLPGVLDIEYNPYGSTCYGLSKKKMVSWIHSFTREYYKQTKRHAVIYTTTDWWRRCTGDDASFKKNPLWIARYGTKKPGTLPKGFTSATFWQYSSTPIDQDVFNTKYKQLKVLATTKKM